MSTMSVTKQMENLFNALVPAVGKAETEAGEMVRAFARVNYRWLNDGDQIGVGYGKETCNAAARYLGRHGDGEVCRILNGMWGAYLSDSEYDAALKELEMAVYGCLKDNEGMFQNPTEDMWDLYDRYEDVDDEEDEDWGW